MIAADSTNTFVLKPYSPLKILFVTLCAFITTCLCFYLMFFLISNELEAELHTETAALAKPSIVEHEEQEPIKTRAKPEKILPLQPPPDPDATVSYQSKRVELAAERPTFGSIAELIGPEDINLDLDAPNSDLMPLNVVQPIYPLRAAMREEEGYVLVEFTVRENGTVANPIVVDSEPAALFDEAALNAIARFKFKPREVGGDRVQVDSVQLRFAFSLESLYDVDYAEAR